MPTKYFKTKYTWTQISSKKLKINIKIKHQSNVLILKTQLAKRLK